MVVQTVPPFDTTVLVIVGEHTDPELLRILQDLLEQGLQISILIRNRGIWRAM
jgi:hypothetical protein